ncbi:MAG: adenosylhomocysteinase, partial [Actinomycetia bacterium]|nr:adenosylhomocysteinase [Actinomycetes bacterium]
MDFDVKDLTRADEGRTRIEWAEADMPVLTAIRERFAVEQTLAGLRIGACMHVTTETANLMRVLVAGGAQVTLCASNPLSTQDDVAAALVQHYGVPVFAIRGEDEATYHKHIDAVIATHPQMTMDDGCDMVSRIHSGFAEQLPEIIGGTEETTTGVIRLRAMEAD